VCTHVEIGTFCHDAYGLYRMDWPPRLLDLNLIENVWTVLKKRIKIEQETQETDYIMHRNRQLSLRRSGSKLTD
jgi:hypothetical protein